MNIWAKMITALRGGINEAGEAIVDSQALRILDQEVRDSFEELKLSKKSLAEIMALHKLEQKKLVECHKKITEHEGYVIKALEKGNEDLALEVAEKIADLEGDVEYQEKSADSYLKNINHLRHVIKHTERNVKRLKQQIDTIKATDNVQRAQATIAKRHYGSEPSMHTAMDSLEKIREKQRLSEAALEAENTIINDNPDDLLRAKLEKAGITVAGNNAKNILERIKNKKQ